MPTFVFHRIDSALAVHHNAMGKFKLTAISLGPPLR